MALAIEAEIDRNFDYFLRHVASFVSGNRGKYALLHNCAVVAFHDSLIDAEREGEESFPDGIFSIQEVTDQPVDLGFFTHAMDQGKA